MASDKILGIDLGTTNSGMAIVEAGDPQMLQNNDGKRLTPSVVHYDEEGNVLVGRQAIDREPAEPDQVVREIKRHMGEDGFTVEVAGNEVTPPEVSAEILRKLKSDAESYLGDDVEEAVVTVHAYFTIDQTKATKEATEQAGFETTHLLNEPTAAALAYGNGKELDETLLVYDFGGGTLDISLIDVAEEEYKVLATDGDNRLGGTDYTMAMMELLADRYEADHGEPLLEDEDGNRRDEIWANLRSEAEETKISLSSNEEAEALAPFLGQIQGDIVSMEEPVTRSTFEAETEALQDRAIEPVETVLDKAGLSTDDVDNVLLVGGSTRIPVIQDQLEDYVGVEPTMTLDPDKIVAQGAAVYAQREIESGYRCPVCGKEYDALLKLNEHYDEGHGSGDDEYECTHCDETFESEDERQQHQATAHDGGSGGEGDDDGDDDGDGGSITNRDSGITDIISHSLGTKLEDGSMAVLIEQGTNTEDSEATDLFTTTEDDQTVIPVGVYQGESDVAEENEKIGEVRLTDIPPRPAGEPRIEITFDYDDDGILHVEAVDQDSGDEVNGEIEM